MALATAVLRARRQIWKFAAAGGALALAIGLLTKRVYVSEATFIPQASESGVSSSLALSASQFGIKLPSSSAEWGPPIYVELIRLRELLEPIARDTVTVVEEGGRRTTFMDLLEVKNANPQRRLHDAVRELGKVIDVNEDKRINAVRLAVATPWPSVSLALAERLVRGVNQFNLQTRKSQASAERQFVEVQAGEAESTLREAEDRLQAFMQRNRTLSGSAELTLERDRFQRDVTLRQQLYTSLLQSLEEARIREVRDTPVITMLEAPKLAAVSESRKLAQKVVLGGFVGAIIAIVIALISQGLRGAREAPSHNAREFFGLMEEATPRFLRRRQH